MTKLHYIDLDEKVKPSAEKCRVNDIYIYIYIKRYKKEPITIHIFQTKILCAYCFITLAFSNWEFSVW